MKPNVIKVNRKLIALAGESSRQRILGVLSAYSDRAFSLTDLAKESGVAKSNIGPLVKEFEEMGLISIERLTKIWRIRANLSSWAFKKSKIVRNLNFIYQSGLVEYLNEKFRNPRAIILFGSYRTGDDVSTSDIDIAIESDEPREMNTIHLAELESFENVIHRKIQIHTFHRKHVDQHVFSNIANGIVLLGHLETHP